MRTISIVREKKERHDACNHPHTCRAQTKDWVEFLFLFFFFVKKKLALNFEFSEKTQNLKA